MKPPRLPVYSLLLQRQHLLHGDRDPANSFMVVSPEPNRLKVFKKYFPNDQGGGEKRSMGWLHKTGMDLRPRGKQADYLLPGPWGQSLVQQGFSSISVHSLYKLAFPPPHVFILFLRFLRAAALCPTLLCPHGPEQMVHSKYLLNNENKAALPALSGLFLNR